MTENKLKPIDVSKYTVTDTGQVLKMNKEVEVIQRPTYAELEEKISILLSCKNCPENKGGYICQKEYEDKCLAQKIQYIKELKEENAELKEEIKNNEDLATVAYMQGAENQKKKADKQLTKAKEIIKRLLQATYGEGWNYSLQVKVEAEQFLKEYE